MTQHLEGSRKHQADSGLPEAIGSCCHLWELSQLIIPNCFPLLSKDKDAAFKVGFRCKTACLIEQGSTEYDSDQSWKVGKGRKNAGKGGKGNFGCANNLLAKEVL